MDKYLGLDIGSKTIGLAWTYGVIVSPGITIRFLDEDYLAAIEQLSKIIKNEKPKIIVCGYPINMDGSIGERAQLVDHFIEALLMYNSNIKEEQIIRIDERRTTIMANSIMREAGIRNQKRKQKKDSLAAQLILEQYLELNRKAK